jgi:hypothetical protein
MRRLKIDLSELTEAFDNTSPEVGYFLDLESGQVVLITSDTRYELEQIYAAIYGAGDEPQMPFADALRSRDLPDWQQTMLTEAGQVEAGFGTRYIRVPGGDSREGYRDMEAFIATVRDVRLANRLERAISGRGAFRYFKDVLLDHPRERERWFAFKDQQLRALEWLAEEKIEVIEE